MPEINFHEISETTCHLTYVVLVTRYNDQWVVVQHKERTTWEMPGGHIEPGETTDQAACRELVEETGAVEFECKAVTDYSVTMDGHTGFGRLYYCYIEEIGPLGDSEIGKVRTVDGLPDEMTYPDIQPVLLDHVIQALAL